MSEKSHSIGTFRHLAIAATSKSMTYLDWSSILEIAVRSNVTPSAANRPAKSSWDIRGEAFKRATRTFCPIKFRSLLDCVFFIANSWTARC